MTWGVSKVVEEVKVMSKEERIELIQKRLRTGKNFVPDRLVALISGREGTMKSGSVLNYINDKIGNSENKVCRYIDLDGGSDVLLHHHPKLKDKCFITNPLTFKLENNSYTIDYEATFNNIKEDISNIKELYDYGDNSFGILVIDGLSSLLGYAEKKMRYDKNLTADAGIHLRFWLERNKHFEEILEFCKSISCDIIFISHEDFIRNDDGKDLANVKKKTLALVHQIIEMCKIDKGDDITFTAKIHKSKYNIMTEGKTFIISEKKKDKYYIKTDELFKSLKPQK